MYTSLAHILDYAASLEPDENSFLTYAAVSPYARHLIEHDYGGLHHPNFTCRLCDSTVDFFKQFVYSPTGTNDSLYGGSGRGKSGRARAAAHQRHDVLAWSLERMQERRAARYYGGYEEPWVCAVQIRGPMSDFARAWSLSKARYTTGGDANMVFGISSDFLFRTSVAFPPSEEKGGEEPLDIRFLHLNGRRISLADCLTPSAAGSSASFRHLTALYLTQCFDLNRKGMQPPPCAGTAQEKEGDECLYWDVWMPSLRVLYVSGGLFDSLDFLVTPPPTPKGEGEGRAEAAATDRPQSALEEVYLFACPIQDATALASCRALRVLVLQSHALEDISWIQALPKLHYVDLTEASGVTDLKPLATLPVLEVLRVSGCGNGSLHWALLAEEHGHQRQEGHFSESLRYLDVSGSLFFDDDAFIDERVVARAAGREPQRGQPQVFQHAFPQLRILKMSGSGATHLDFLAFDYSHKDIPEDGAEGLFPELEKMDVSVCSSLLDLSMLSHLRGSLRVLDASNISQAFDLPAPCPPAGPCDNWLQAARFAQLEEVNFSSCTGITQLASLAFLSHCLRRLSLRHCQGLTSLSGLKNCTRLEVLDVTLCHNLSDINALRGLGGSLRALYASVTAIADINSVFGHNTSEGQQRTFTPSPFIHLEDLNLADVTDLVDVSVVWELPALRRLDLSDCEALEFMEVGDHAALTGFQKSKKQVKGAKEQVPEAKKDEKWLRDKKRFIREHCKLERLSVSGCNYLSDQSKKDIETYVQAAALEVVEVFTSDEDEQDDLDTLMA